MVSDWSKVLLEEIAEIVGGGTPSKADPTYWNGNIPWATPTDLTSSKVRVTSKTKNYITEEGLAKSSAKLMPAGSVLMTSRATIGECAINLVPMATNQGFTNFVCKEGTFNKYLYYLLGFLRPQFETLGSGSTFKEISKKTLKSYIVNMPPYMEQQKISAILTSVDNAIEKTESIIEQTEKVKKGLMQQLLTKGISHTKFKETEIGEIPEEWEVKSFNQLLEEKTIINIQDGNHGSVHPKAADYVENGISFIMANNLINSRLNLSNCNFISKEQADRLRIGFSYPGDVLLSHKGTIGRVAIVPEVEHYIMLTPQVTYYRVDNNSSLFNEFLALYFKGERFQSSLKSLSAQSTRSYIGITNQKKLLINLPPLEEQKKIVDIISSIESKITQESQKLLHLKFTKKGLMQVLLTGKVRVNVDEMEVTR